MKSFLSFLHEDGQIMPAILAASLAAAPIATQNSSYKVQKGDTISAIAKNNKLTVQQIMDFNPNLKNPNKILIGQNLNLSTPTSTQNTSTEEPQPTTKKETKTPGWNPLISKFEGFKTEAYWDKKGKVWTLGKGSTTHPDGRPIRQGDTISKEQADTYMQHYVTTKVIPTLSKSVPNWSEMNSNQQNALISFGYNLGPNFYGSSKFDTITRALSSKENWSQVPSALKLYNKSDGQVLPGLITRRATEGALWSSPIN